jgi:hypothetical protein
MVVTQPERRHVAGFLLKSGEADPLALALARAGVRPGRQGAAAVDGGFLEHLLAYLAPPRQADYHQLGHTGAVHNEYPAGVLGFLPRIECVD